jgi:cytochrome c biogenesis protein ResB
MKPNDIGSVMLSGSHVSWNCVSGAVLTVPQMWSSVFFIVFVFVFFACVFVLVCCCFVLHWFLRSILSLTGLRSVSDEIDLKKSRHHKSSSKHKTNTQAKNTNTKTTKKQNNDLT